MGSVWLDRAGRVFIAIGGLVVIVLAAPIGVIAVLASFSLGGSLGTIALAAMAPGVVVAGIVAIVMMLRGSTRWLALGGIGAAIVGTVAFVYVARSGAWVAVPSQILGAGAYAMALGAALRLIARRTEPPHGRG